jgi:cholesterol oxidase
MSAGCAYALSGPASRADAPELFDAVVIGSGFGGSVVACRLAQAGRSVCILERGKRWRNCDFPTSLPDFLRRGLWNEGQSYGPFDYRPFECLEVLQGAGVGGGALVYYGVSLRPQMGHILQTGRWPAAFNSSTLDPYYVLAEQMLEVRPSPCWPKTNAFFQATRAAGGEPFLTPLSHVMRDRVSFPDQERTASYLRVAEERFGVEVRPLCLVDRIEPSGQLYRVHYRHLNPNCPGSFTEQSVLGRKVIVAAGSVGSTELLLRCRDLHQSLPRLSPLLGGRFSSNGDYIFAGAQLPAKVRPMAGPPISAAADFSSPQQPILVQDVAPPDGLTSLLAATQLGCPRLFNLLRNQLTLKAGHSPEHQRPACVDRRLLGSAHHLLPFLVMGMDTGDGVLSLRCGSLNLAWNAAENADRVQQLQAVLRQISQCAGGDFRESLWLQTTPRRLLTAHPLGGCIMSDRPQAGVVDHRGQVWHYENLYVADGAVVPGPLATNPSLTICALAERIAFWMLHRREMQPGDPLTPADP